MYYHSRGRVHCSLSRRQLVKCTGPQVTHYLQALLIGQNKSHDSSKLGEGREISSFHVPRGRGELKMDEQYVLEDTTFETFDFVFLIFMLGTSSKSKFFSRIIL